MSRSSEISSLLDGDERRATSVRDRLREILRRHGLADEFDAVMAWEDEMLAFCNETAERLDRTRSALADVLEVLAVAQRELVERNDKDFFWRDRVADFVNVARATRRRYRRLARG
jgi:hypothetical protein